MREWGLLVSRGRSDDEPALFNEPGLSSLSPDGKVYYESILSMPASQPASQPAGRPAARGATTGSMPSTTGPRSVIPLEATPDRRRYASEIDSEGLRVAPRHQCDSLER